MPISIKTVSKVLILTWSNEDRTTEASWKIPSDATDETKLRLLQKAVGFMQLQMGAGPAPAPAVPTAESPTSTVPLPPAPTGTISGTPGSGLILPMATGSYSDRPSDGGPPTGSTDKKFWDSMPSALTADMQANQEHGWEMDPGAGGGW